MAADSPVDRSSSRTDRPRERKPLRRRPKQLTEDPTLFEAAAGGNGAGLTVRGERSAAAPGRTPPGRSAAGNTDDDAELVAPDPRAQIDAEAVRRARRIAARLSIPRARRDVLARRGVGELASVRYAGGSDDIDLDATLESLVAHPVPEDGDIVVRERLRTHRSVVLAVDVSGSMRGERARTAAATVGALYGELARDDLAVIAFWSDAALLVPLGRDSSAQQVLDMLLRLPSQGLTNVAFPLQIAAQQLARVPARDARVLLLSDCVHNAGPDPRGPAVRLPRLDVLLDNSGEHDLDLARELARAGHGRLAVAPGYRAVGPAVSALFAA